MQTEHGATWQNLFDRMLILQNRFLYLCLYSTGFGYKMFATSQTSDLNFEVNQGKCMATIIEGKMKIYSDDQTIRDDMRHSIEIYNTRIAEMPFESKRGKNN